MRKKVEDIAKRMETHYKSVFLSSWKFYGSYLDMKWLINTMLNNLKRIESLESNHKTSMENNRRLRKENKRYREAIERAVNTLDDFERYGNKCATNAYITLVEALEEQE